MKSNAKETQNEAGFEESEEEWDKAGFTNICGGNSQQIEEMLAVMDRINGQEKQKKN